MHRGETLVGEALIDRAAETRDLNRVGARSLSRANFVANATSRAFRHDAQREESRDACVRVRQV